jgi:hypothetical protein
MPTFQHNLLGIGKFCDKDCTVVFKKTATAVTVFAKDGTSLLRKAGENQMVPNYGASLFSLTKFQLPHGH